MALSYTESDLTENWDTIYTLQYGTSDLTLDDGSGLETDLGTSGDNDLDVTIPANCASAVTPVITIEPLLTGGTGGIYSDDNGVYTINIDLQDSSRTSLEDQDITITGSNPLQIKGTATFTLDSDQIKYVVVTFNNPATSGFGAYGGPYGYTFESQYEQLKITIEDA